MNKSMSSMAIGMHLENSTVYDLLQKEESINSDQNITKETSNQVNEDSSETKTLGIITTVIIFGLLPLILGGSIILAIVWIK
ncbi:hypothetical protein bsdtb5_08790 [Anaeromicropila herbilytica]|uniref:Uncharacterized protein n=2 Tax=Anaeromicropila herbilytica TaxID=2785025 RepID=A0A7R7IC64_9FIRM|nr:hypothetical protein bsdtb5_08790 [Anaeromicropila herbilytica]